MPRSGGHQGGPRAEAGEPPAHAEDEAANHQAAVDPFTARQADVAPQQGEMAATRHDEGEEGNADGSAHHESQGRVPGPGQVKEALDLPRIGHAGQDEAQAEAQGLITEAVPADQLKARVLEVCEVLKKKDGNALRATKWTMRRMVDMTYDNGLEYQIRAQEALHSFGGAAARKEATRQFLDEKSFKPGLGTFDTSKVQG